MIKNSSIEGDIVLDTFSGSGTTFIACLELKRNFIGFEIDENNYEISQQRVSNFISTPKLEL